MKNLTFKQFIILIAIVFLIIVAIITSIALLFFPSEPKENFHLKTADSLAVVLKDAQKELALTKDSLEFSREKIITLSKQYEKDRKLSDKRIDLALSNLSVIHNGIQDLLQEDASDTLDSELLHELYPSANQELFILE